MSCNALWRRGFSAFHFSNGVPECAYPGRSPCLRWLLTPSVWGWHFALAIALLCCLAKQRPSFWAFFSSCSSSHIINLNHNLRQTWSWECCPQRHQQAVAFTAAPKPPTQMAKNRFMIFIVHHTVFLDPCRTCPTTLWLSRRRGRTVALGVLEEASFRHGWHRASNHH